MVTGRCGGFSRRMGRTSIAQGSPAAPGTSSFYEGSRAILPVRSLLRGLLSFINSDGSPSAAVAYPSRIAPPEAERLAGAGTLCSSGRLSEGLDALKPRSALAPGLLRRPQTSAAPGSRISQKPNKTRGSVRFLCRAEKVMDRNSRRFDHLNDRSP